MDLLEYTALFRSLLYLGQKFSCNSLPQDIRNKLTPILTPIINDIINLFSLYQEEHYNMTIEKQKDFHYKFLNHIRCLDALIEELGLLKECSKCKREYPATNKYFYPDKKSKTGLRPECKDCYSKAKKEYYLKRVRT